MELRGLRSLVILKESGSLTKCAEQLNLSAAAIHKQLKVLEEELSVRLYEKAGRRLRLTQAAEVLLPHVRSLLAQYDAALSALDEWKGLKRGTVRIGTGPTMSSYILPPLLEKFRGLYSDVELYVETGRIQQLAEALAGGSVDLIILVSSEVTDRSYFKVERTWDFEIVLVSGSRQFPKGCRMSDLKKLPFILYKEGSLFEGVIDRYFADFGFRPRAIMRFDNAEAIKAMTRLGYGVSALPMWIVNPELKDKKLFLIRQRERPLYGKIALVTRSAGYIPQPVAAFLDIARNWNWSDTPLTTR
jgi:DNA-binding transcriptional LysR family regulator